MPVGQRLTGIRIFGLVLDDFGGILALARRRSLV